MKCAGSNPNVLIASIAFTQLFSIFTNNLNFFMILFKNAWKFELKIKFKFSKKFYFQERF